MDKVFLQIFNTAITAGWLVLAVLVARLLLKKAPAWIKCALWAIVALRLVWPFEIESILSLLPSSQTIPEAELYAAVPQLHTGVDFVNSTINPVFSEVFATEPANSVNPLQAAVILGGWVWVTGMIVMASYSLMSYWRLRRKVCPAVRQEGNVYLCDGISSPFILGIIKPKIYLPSELSPEKWDSVLAHERTHLARRDHWWKPLGFLLLTVFWFHPLLWIAYILLCRDVELACDEKVIASLSSEEKRSYSQILLECSVPQKWITACPLAFGETGVKQRIKAVLHYRKPTLWILIAALIAGTVLAVCFLTDPKADANIQVETPGNIPGPAEEWKMIYNVIGLETGSFQLEAFPKDTICWGDGKIEILRGNKTFTLVEEATIYHLGAVDLNFDGYPEICTTVKTAKDGEYVIIYDHANNKTYTMLDSRGVYVYYLYTKYLDGSYYVMCARDDVKTGKAVDAGRLIFTEGEDGWEPAIMAPTLQSQSNDTVTVLFDQYHPDSAHQGEVELDGFPGVFVRWYSMPNSFVSTEKPVIVKNGKETALFEDFPSLRTLYITDVTGDGKPDFCADIYYFFSGLPSFNAVIVYDYANDRYYTLGDGENTNHNTKVSYYLRMENGQLVCDKITESMSSLLATGKLVMEDNGDNRSLRMEPLVTYDSPVDYIYVGEHGLDRVELSVIHEGKCRFHFGYKPEGEIYRSGALSGTYVKEDGKLIFTTEDHAVYVFKFEGDDLIFVAADSDELPEDCILFDGAVLKANMLFE